MKKLGQKYNEYDFIPFVIWALDHLVARFLVFVCSFWMRIIFVMNGAICGKKLKVDGTIKVRCSRKGSITIGDNCKINARTGSNLIGRNNPVIFHCKSEGSIQIGNNCGLSFVVISSSAGISIGDNTIIGANVRILDHNYHSLNFMDRRDGDLDQRGVKSAPIKIGNDVFVGANTFILKGVDIGDRVIIGAASVVSCDIPAGEVWAGNPARKVGEFG